MSEAESKSYAPWVAVVLTIIINLSALAFMFGRIDARLTTLEKDNVAQNEAVIAVKLQNRDLDYMKVKLDEISKAMKEYMESSGK